MKTVVQEAGLAMFLPDNLPSEQEMQDGVDSWRDAVAYTTEPLRTSGAIAAYVHHSCFSNTYDEDSRSLEASLQDKKANCLAETALTVLVGRVVLEGRWTPTIESGWSRDGEKSFHALTTLVVPDLAPVRCDTYTGCDFYRERPPTNGHALINNYIIEHADTLDHDGIVQARVDDDGLHILLDHESRQPYEASVRQTYTYFPGDEGLKSYLTTLEVLSARRQERTPETFPGQLVPRL